jgi:hypothetical protein
MKILIPFAGMDEIAVHISKTRKELERNKR